MSVPTATVLAQRLRGLEKANDIRIRRRDLKAQIAGRQVRVEDVIREPEWFAFSAPVHEVLCWAPQIGLDTSSRVLRKAGVWPLRELGALTAGQRERVLAELAK